MEHEVEREIVLDAGPEEVWRSLVEPDRLAGWLGTEVAIDLRPGGELTVRDPVDGPRDGWVERVEPRRRLALWWSRQGEESTRVEFELTPREEGTALRVVESRPLADLEVQVARLRGPMAMA